MQVSLASMTGILAEGRAQRDKQAQARAEAKLSDAKSAVETLKHRNTASANDAAEQRKARLRMLQISGGGDPKILAQLARELKSAVKAYGGSGGSAAEPVAVGATSGAGAAGPVQSATAVETTSAETATDQAAATAQAALADAAGQKEPYGQEGRKDDGEARSETNPYQRMAQEAQMRASQSSRHGAAQKADRDFLSDARSLAEQIKTLAKRAQQQVKTDALSSHDADQASQAAADAAQAVESAGRDLGAASVSLTV